VSGISVTKNDKVLRDLIADFPADADRGLAGAGEQMVGDIKQSLGTGPPGESYTIRGVTHVASSPGFPPNTDVADLIGSIRLVRVGHLNYKIQDGVEHGIHMEEGTPDIEPRPFINPVFEEWRPKIAGEIRRVINL